MSKYNFSISNKITKNGEPFYEQGPMTWFGIPAAHLHKLLDMSDRVAKNVEQAANRGGALTIVMNRTATALDGGELPPNASGELTYTGLTYNSLARAQRAMHDVGRELLDMGDEHAKHRDHKA